MRNQKGYTLVELLIVICIVGVLLSAVFGKVDWNAVRVWLSKVY